LVVLAGVIATLIGVPLLAMGLVDRREKRRPEAAPGDSEARRIALDAIRHLDKALVDPMYRQSSEWEDEARRLVDSYYGTKGLTR
jgi:hypothetical protein